MERKENEKKYKKILNRITSYIILVAGIFLVSFSISKVVEYVQVYNENKDLSEVLTSLEEENNRLKLLNAKLEDDGYLSFFEMGGYQYDGNNVIKIGD